MDAKELKKAMLDADFTQSTLAEALGIHINTLNLKINGKCKFDVDEATRICEILKIRDKDKKIKIFLS